MDFFEAPAKLFILILIGILIIIVATLGIIISVIKVLSARKLPDKNCQFCGELIPFGAVVCPNCKEILD